MQIDGRDGNGEKKEGRQGNLGRSGPVQRIAAKQCKFETAFPQSMLYRHVGLEHRAAGNASVKPRRSFVAARQFRRARFATSRPSREVGDCIKARSESISVPAL